MTDDVHLVTYSDDRFGHRGGRFRDNQRRLNDSARRRGIGRIEEWTFERLSETPFYREHERLLDLDRYANGVPWKPYVVLETLRGMEAGALLWYVDCAALTLDEDPAPLIDLCRRHGSVIAEWGDRNRNWTKRDAFALMGLDEARYHDAPHLLNTWFLLARNEANLALVEEWLRYNLDPNVASYESTAAAGLPELPGHVQSRGDQSILSLLACKHGYPTFPGTFHGLKNKNVNLFLRSLGWSRTRTAIFRALRCDSRLLRSATGMDPKWACLYALSRIGYATLGR